MADSAPPARPAAAVPTLIRELCHPRTSAGQLAQLRRGGGDPDSPALWWLLARLENSGDNPPRLRDEELPNWALLCHLLALLTPPGQRDEGLRRHLHTDHIALGRALFEGGEPGRERPGYGELRLAALLAARGPQFAAKLSRAVRYLARVEQGCDCRELAALIFDRTPAGRPTGPRQRLARHYYRRRARAAGADTDPEDAA